MPERRRPAAPAAALAALSCLALVASLPLPAHAAPWSARRRFDIPSGPLVSSLLEFAVQARTSIGLGPASSCRPQANAVIGDLMLKEALARLLAGTGCTFQVVDAGAVRIVRTPRNEPSGTAPRALAKATAPRPPDPRRAPPPAMLAPPPPVEEIVVTTTRRAALLDRAAYSVSVIGSGELTAHRSFDVDDLMAQVAGLSVTNLGPGRDKIFLRGLSDGALTGRTQSTVAIYLDDVRITYNAPDPDLRLVDVDRVEVLRGPQGALYGAGSIGGILHIVTRQPQLDGATAEVSATGSATAHGAESHAMDGVLNLPLVVDRVALRVAAYQEVQGGYIDNVRLALKDVGRTRRTGVRAAVKLQVDPDWSATAALRLQFIDSDDTRYVDPSLGKLRRATLLQEPHDNDFRQVSLGIAGEKPWGRVLATAAILRHDYDSRYDASMALPLFVPGAPALASPFDEANRSEVGIAEVTVASAENRRLRWLVGGFYARGENDSDTALTAPLGPAGAARAVYQESRRDLIDEKALYGELSYSPTARITASVGGRWFRSRVDTRSEVRQPLSGGVSRFNGSNAVGGFAPQLTIRYQPSDRTTVYAQAAWGYRTPGFNTSGTVGQAFSDGAGGLEPRRLYDGDELVSYEAGIKLALLDGALRLRAAAFYMIWEDVQSDQLLDNGLPFTANIGDAQDHGAELDAVWRLGPNWRLDANLTLAAPELVRPNPGFPARADNRLAGVPDVEVGGALAYSRPVGDSAALSLRAGYAYVGHSRLTFDETVAPKMGDYALGKISAGLQVRRWRAEAFLDLPLGAEADTFAYGDPFTLRQVPQSTPPRPATVGLQVSARFE